MPARCPWVVMWAFSPFLSTSVAAIHIQWHFLYVSVQRITRNRLHAPLGFPGSSAGKESAGPWVRKISWKRERLSTPIFWPGEFHGLYSPWRRKESDMTEWLSLLLSQCRGHEFHLWLGNKDPCCMVQPIHTRARTCVCTHKYTHRMGRKHCRLAGCIYQADPPKKTQPTKQPPTISSGGPEMEKMPCRRWAHTSGFLGPNPEMLTLQQHCVRVW